MADKVLKHIPEQKLKAFSIGTMGKRQPSKRELEEQRKKEQEKAAAQAFEEFVATFQEPTSKNSKVWVKAGTYDAGKRQEDTKEKGKLYKPQSRLDFAESGGGRGSSTAEKAQEYARLLGERSRPERPGKRREREKKKSNLELFKEELKMIQEEREERHKYKGQLGGKLSGGSLGDSDIVKSSYLSDEKGSFDSGDPNTTNIYLGNINPKITEQQLMDVFGKYGPLASIKIMWPRSDEEKLRGRNCGFVAFMNRRDGDRAMKALNGKEVLGYEMKLGWGKGVPIPPFPIYIPPALLSLTQPPPPSGLPFNAQPHPKDKHKVPRMRPNEPYPVNPEDAEKVEKVWCGVTMQQPIVYSRHIDPHHTLRKRLTGWNLLMLIHHMIEYVIREGPMFEAMIMNKEINNPMFRFLFDNQSPAHVYYRWKLFSLLQGDSQKDWSLREFRMFKGGSIWRPPPMNLYTQGMPEELVEREEERKGGLSPAQRDRLEQLIRAMTPERLKVADAMVFCIEHAEAADEICDCILESLSNPATLLYKKVARLYLVSDILHNCSIKITNASNYRRCLESRLVEMFEQAHQTYLSLESRLKAESYKLRVLQIFRAWDDWAVYPREFLLKLRATFLGAQPEVEEEEEVEDKYGASPDLPPPEDITNPDLDGVPLDGVALLKGAYGNPFDDIDGIPMDDIDGEPLDDEPGRGGSTPVSGGAANTPTSGSSSKKRPPETAFVPSRWEEVDPRLIEAQALTTSKWELLEEREQQLQGAARGRGASAGGEGATSSATPLTAVGDEINPFGSYASLRQDNSPASNDSSRDGGGTGTGGGGGGPGGGGGSEESRRARLREIEVKVMQYQDELESGKRSVKAGWSMSEQIEHHRKKLLRKAEKAESKEAAVAAGSKSVEKPLRRSLTPDESTSDSRYKRSRRSKSSTPSPPPSKRSNYRSRSRSPYLSSSSSSRRRTGGGGGRSRSPLPPSRRREDSPPPPARGSSGRSSGTTSSSRARSPRSPDGGSPSSSTGHKRRHSSSRHKHKHRH